MTTAPCIVVLATGMDPDAPAALAATLRHAVQTGWPVCAVVTPEQAPVAAHWIATRDIVVPDASTLARGLGACIAAGVAAQADAAGWLLLPGAMSRVRPQTLKAVGAALSEHAVAYAQHRGQPGLPQAFAAELFSELVALQDAGGARRLLARYPAVAVEVDDPGVLPGVQGRDGPAPGPAPWVGHPSAGVR